MALSQRIKSLTIATRELFLKKKVSKVVNQRCSIRNPLKNFRKTPKITHVVEATSANFYHENLPGNFPKIFRKDLLYSTY